MSSKIEVSLVDRLEDIAQDLTFMKDRNTIREAVALLAELQATIAKLTAEIERLKEFNRG
ncbi:hypothetical protein D3C72_1814190 [compost metagenome]